ncbi:MAG: hypothetical protein HC818_06825 [Synechococcaceae cyanobacterium RM1_1_27]|nr:hypothetical protein [Synechococcaceae cyanobacterium RM1_1_27]
MSELGTVYLVGAGIGGSHQLTLDATAVLHKADVVLMDDLVSPEVASQIPAHAVVIPVGKRGGQVSFSQEQINALLLHHALPGIPGGIGSRLGIPSSLAGGWRKWKRCKRLGSLM